MSAFHFLSCEDTVRNRQSVGGGLRSSGSNKLPWDATVGGPRTRLWVAKHWWWWEAVMNLKGSDTCWPSGKYSVNIKWIRVFKYMHVCACQDHVQLFATPWTIAGQAPLSIGFFMQQHRSRLLYPPPGDLPDPGIEPTSPAAPALQADLLLLNHQGSPVKVYEQCLIKAYSISHIQKKWAVHHWKKGSHHNLTTLAP